MSDVLNVCYNNKPCYDIIFDSSFDGLASKIEELGFKNRKIAIITDSKVQPLYGDAIKEQLSTVSNNVFIYAIPAGEENKNLKEIEKIYEYLIQNHFDRHDLLIALGGGVVGDMTGFAAATYLRGIAFVQIPTTLLAQCDSSIGGKTGVDFNAYKNMVGAFYMPKLVYMNIGTLNSLDDENFACGMGEVIKHGLIADETFYNWIKNNKEAILAREYDALSYMVMKNCDIKRNVVEIDPKEKGIRAYLNFGHTIGHAIEKLADFKLGHGQCVSLGMVCALHLSHKLGYISENEIIDITKTLVDFNLPTSFCGLNHNEVLMATKSDKKMQGNKIKFTILKKVGQADSYMDFTDEDLLFAIDKVLDNVL